MIVREVSVMLSSPLQGQMTAHKTHGSSSHGRDAAMASAMTVTPALVEVGIASVKSCFGVTCSTKVYEGRLPVKKEIIFEWL